MADSLTSFIETVLPESHLRVQDDLGDGFVRLKVSEAQRRQAIQDIRSIETAVIEMLRNSRDAQARNIYVASWREAQIRHITVIDDGQGIPVSMHELVFEPRVTSKLDTFHEDKWGAHGRGMALYSIAQRALKAQVNASFKGGGSSISASFDTKIIPEKTDQSTFPLFTFESPGHVSITGPKNIIRTCCEFALEHRKTLNVYIGSPSQIATTLYQNTLLEIPLQDRLHTSDLRDVHITDQLAYGYDAESFAHIATSLGLSLGERTALRVLDAEYEPLDDLAHMVRSVIVPKKSSPPRKPKRQRETGFSTQDINAFRDEISQAYASLARAYYLDECPDIAIRQSKGTLQVSIDIRQLPNEKY